MVNKSNCKSLKKIKRKTLKKTKRILLKKGNCNCKNKCVCGKKKSRKKKIRGGSLISIEPTNIVSSFGKDIGAKSMGVVSGTIPNVSSNVIDQPLINENSKYNTSIV